MGFLIPIIYFLMANASMVFITKKSFGKCLPLTIMLSAFSLFFSQIIFKTFNVGYYINIIFALFSILLCLFNLKSIKSFFNNYFTNGLYVFITIYVFVFIFDFKRSFVHWDEWSHWGVMVKEMLRLDKFYFDNASTLLVHKDYPPIVQLFELFWIKLCGGYSETRMIRALHTLEISLIIPAISEFKFKKNNIIKTILITICSTLSLLLIIAFFDQHGVINSIYIDYFMAILIAYCLFSIVQYSEKYSSFLVVLLIVSGSFLLLTKQMGIPLYLMILFFYFINTFVTNKTYKNVKISKIIISSLLLIVMPFITLFIWNYQVKNLDVEKQFVLSDIKVSQLGNIIRKQSGKEYQQISANNYISAIKTRNFTTSHIQLTYFQACFVALAILYLIYKLYKKNIDVKTIKSLIVTLVCGILGYAFVMLNMYVFCFGDREGPNLASIDRYMSTFIIILFIIDLMIYLYYSLKDEDNNIIKYFIVFIVLFSIQGVEKCDSIYFSYKLSDPNIYEAHANVIKGHLKDNEKVYIIAQDTSSEYNYFINYYLDSIFVNIKNYSFDTSDDIDYKLYFEKNIEKYMLNYNYLYLAVINDEFINKYNYLFPNEKINAGNIYKINNIGGKVKLSKIN